VFSVALYGDAVADDDRVGVYGRRMMLSLETERLVLRPLQSGDLDVLVTLHAEESFWQYPLGRAETAAETRGFLQRVLDDYSSNGFGLAAVVVRERGDLVGWCGLSIPNFLPEILPAVEVGWRLGSAWRGQGYATEAGGAWVDWGFESLGLDRIVSIFEPANVASGRVMEKLGFELDMVTIDPAFHVDLHVTALTRERWAELRAASS
jgi:RimJ/RimL family protein N-acetyltransferase